MHHHLLATGRYLTSLPRSVVHFAPHMRLKDLPVRWPAQIREVAIVTLHGCALSPVARTFVEELRVAALALTRSRRRKPPY